MRMKIDMSKVKNMTPHEVIVENEDGRFVFPPSGELLRIPSKRRYSSFFQGELEIQECIFQPEKIKLPDPEQLYIVSLPTLLILFATHRPQKNIVAPDTDRAIRDDKGRITAVPGFIRIVSPDPPPDNSPFTKWHDPNVFFDKTQYD
jgi:hypothetical protein